MKTNKSKGISDHTIDIILLVIGIIIFLIAVYPLYFVVIASFSSPSAVAGGQVWLLPKSDCSQYDVCSPDGWDCRMRKRSTGQ